MVLMVCAWQQPYVAPSSASQYGSAPPLSPLLAALLRFCILCLQLLQLMMVLLPLLAGGLLPTLRGAQEVLPVGPDA